MRLTPHDFGGLAMIGRDLIESIEFGTISLGSTSGTYSIVTPVDWRRTVLVDLRQSNNWSGGSQPAYTSTRLEPTGTTITATRNASGGLTTVAGFVIVQLRPGVVRSVQYRVASGNGTRDVTIDRVDLAKAFPMSLGLEGDSGGLDGYFYGRWSLPDAVTVRLTRDLSGGASMHAGVVVVEGW